jgi:hypothetical protein
MKKGSDKIKISILLLSIIFFLSFIPLISSAPIKFSGSPTVGIDIEHPYFNPYQYGKDIRFQFHIFNSTTGMPILANKLLTNCSFHLYNSTGSHIFENNWNVGGDDILDYSQKITKGNFSYIGQYAYVFQCNSTTAGGYYSNSFEVTPNGDFLTSSSAILYFLVTLFAFLILGILIYIFVSMDGSNPQSSEGDYLSINYKKYVKTALFPLVYVVFLWAFNFIIGLSNNYLGLTLYANTLGFIFMILTKGIYPIILLTFIWEIVLMIKDANVTKEYKSLWG